MKVLPIQVTEEGVLIPLDYLHNAREFEFELQNDTVLVRPRSKPGESERQKKSWLHELVGIAESKDPTASERVEEIIEAEIDRRSGFTQKPSVDENS
jgi:hypothetical protein